MKVWEALEILEGLDTDMEVMLTIGKVKKPVELPRVPKFQYLPEFRFPSTPAMPTYPEPPWTVTCVNRTIQ